MSVFKCLTAVWVSVIIYAILSAFFGASGFSAYEAVFTEKERLADNLEDLQEINQQLNGSFAALQYDSDTIAVYARELGYGAPNEHFIRISGLPSVIKKSVSAGQQILPVFPTFIPDKIIHITSIVGGLFTLLLFIVFDMKKKKLIEEA
jgi:cell division protein FtsB